MFLTFKGLFLDLIILHGAHSDIMPTVYVSLIVTIEEHVCAVLFILVNLSDVCLIDYDYDR
jgi:hypothetical protein